MSPWRKLNVSLFPKEDININDEKFISQTSPMFSLSTAVSDTLQCIACFADATLARNGQRLYCVGTLAEDTVRARLSLLPHRGLVSRVRGRKSPDAASAFS
jgi:hypothetical protein